MYLCLTAAYMFVLYCLFCLFVFLYINDIFIILMIYFNDIFLIFLRILEFNLILYSFYLFIVYCDLLHNKFTPKFSI